MTGLAGDSAPPPLANNQGPRGWTARRPVGALLCVAAAVLTLVGSFGALFSYAYRFGGEAPFAFAITITSWSQRVDSASPGFRSLDDTPPNGVPLAFAAVVLLVAAVLGLRAAPWAANVRIARVRGPMVWVGAAFLAGTVSTIGMQELAWMGMARAVERATGDPVDASVGSGFWMLVAAAVLAIVAALFTRRSATSDQVREEPDTPVLGIPVVVRLQDGPPSPPPPAMS